MSTSLLPVNDTPPTEPGSAGPKPAPVFADAHAKALHRVSLAVAKDRWPITPFDGADPATALQLYIDNDGLGEDPPGSNCNWITHRFGLGCVAWCAEAVSFALNLAFGGDLDQWQVPGVVATYPNGIAYVPYMRAAFDAAGLYDLDRSTADQPASLRPGDVAILFGEGHTGLIEADLGDGTYLTREGNYSDRIGQFRRSRAVLDGVCHPPYGATPPQPDPPPPADPLALRDGNRTVLQIGA